MDMISESLRRSCSVPRNNGSLEMFLSRSHQEDDEEALKWAALEKLPTFDRLRKGLLVGPTGPVHDVDVHGLGLLDRKFLIDKLVKVAETDNEEFLLKLENRIDRILSCFDRVGIELPTIEVRFENLKVEAEAYVGGRTSPSFINFFTNTLEACLSKAHILASRKKPLAILNNVSRILKPSRMTLLLGPPRSGKTKLLLALAGMLDPNLKFSGSVTYNGHGMKEFIPQRTAAYISQHDVHIAEMTVRETLAFSARCQGVGTNLG